MNSALYIEKNCPILAKTSTSMSCSIATRGVRSDWALLYIFKNIKKKDSINNVLFFFFFKIPILFFFFFEKQTHTGERKRGFNTKTHHNSTQNPYT